MAKATSAVNDSSGIVSKTANALVSGVASILHVTPRTVAFHKFIRAEARAKSEAHGLRDYTGGTAAPLWARRNHSVGPTTPLAIRRSISAAVNPNSARIAGASAPMRDGAAGRAVGSPSNANHDGAKHSVTQPSLSRLSKRTVLVGTARVEGTGRGFPWTVILRVDGRTVTGMVTSCASNFGVPIGEGLIDGNTITFKCTNPAGTRTILFTGVATGAQLSLKWKNQLQNSEPNRSFDEALFGDAAPLQFIARRVSDAELLPAEREMVGEVDQVRGQEFAAGVNLVAKDVKIDGRLFLPEKVSHVRAVIVAIYWGLGRSVYWDAQVRALAQTTGSGVVQAWISSIRTNGNDTALNNNAAVGGADSLILLMQRFAQESGHPEIAGAPLLFWGHSTAGPFGPSFAALHPERTIAFVRYHSGPVVGGDLTVISKVPALFFVGGKDPIVGPDGILGSEGARTLWTTGRSAGAPWTFALEPDATHGDEKDLPKANVLLVPWITAVLRQRLSPDSEALRPLNDATAWMGNNATGEISGYSTFSGTRTEASWLPDEQAAQGCRSVLVPTK